MQTFRFPNQNNFYESNAQTFDKELDAEHLINKNTFNKSSVPNINLPDGYIYCLPFTHDSWLELVNLFSPVVVYDLDFVQNPIIGGKFDRFGFISYEYSQLFPSKYLTDEFGNILTSSGIPLIATNIYNIWTLEIVLYLTSNEDGYIAGFCDTASASGYFNRALYIVDGQFGIFLRGYNDPHIIFGNAIPGQTNHIIVVSTYTGITMYVNGQASSTLSFIDPPIPLTTHTNWVRNSFERGVTTGTPGSLPTHWEIINVFSGLTQQIVSKGITPQGFPYFDIRFFGTTTGTGGTLGFDELGGIPATQGQAFSLSAYLGLVSGSWTNVTNINLGLYIFNGAGTFIGNTATTITIDGYGRISVPHLTAYAVNTASIIPRISFSWNNGVAIDFTLRIAMPQCEDGVSISDPIMTDGVIITVGPYFTIGKVTDYNNIYKQYPDIYNNVSSFHTATVIGGDTLKGSKYVEQNKFNNVILSGGAKALVATHYSKANIFYEAEKLNDNFIDWLPSGTAQSFNGIVLLANFLSRAYDANDISEQFTNPYRNLLWFQPETQVIDSYNPATGWDAGNWDVTPTPIIPPSIDALTKALFTGGYLDLRPAGVKIEYVTQSLAGTPFFAWDAEVPTDEDSLRYFTWDGDDSNGWDIGVWDLTPVPFTVSTTAPPTYVAGWDIGAWCEIAA